MQNINFKNIKKNFFSKALKYIYPNFFIAYISAFLAIFSAFIIALTANAYSKNLQSDIAREVIRFHVLANSDSKEDQELKLKVKKEIIEMLETELKSSKCKEETKLILNQNLTKIEEKAREVILKEGYNYTVKAELAYSRFPTKSYGDITLPAGEYEALRILIGNAEGKNWWCVMYPPLCFVDGCAKTVPEEDKKDLKEVLSDEEYNLISSSDKKNIKIKFKVVELFNSL